MTDLSPAAQAVLDAYENTYIDSGLVAAIFKLANQVVPHPCTVRAKILAIATELEAR